MANQINNIVASFAEAATYLFMIATSLCLFNHRMPNGRQNLHLPGNLHEILLDQVKQVTDSPRLGDEYTIIEKAFPNFAPGHNCHFKKASEQRP